MLPDLPAFKQALLKRRERALFELASQKAPLMDRIPTLVQHEGDRYSYQDHSGEIHHERYKPQVTPVRFSNLDSPLEQEQEVETKLEDAADQIAKQHKDLLFTTLSDVTEKAGNAISAHGRPFDITLYLDAMEGLVFDFDDDGKPLLPTMVLHPSQMKRVEAEMKRLDTDPAIAARWAEVLQRKKEEWRVRESHRKLAG